MNETIVKSIFIAILFLKHYCHCVSNGSIKRSKAEELLDGRVTKALEKIDKCGPHEHPDNNILLNIYDKQESKKNISTMFNSTCIQQNDLEFFREKTVLFKYIKENLYNIYQQILEDKDNNLYKVLNILLEEVDQTFKNSIYKSALAKCKKTLESRGVLIPQSLCNDSETESSSNPSDFLYPSSEIVNYITCYDDTSMVETEGSGECPISTI